MAHLVIAVITHQHLLFLIPNATFIACIRKLHQQLVRLTLLVLLLHPDALYNAVLLGPYPVLEQVRECHLAQRAQVSHLWPCQYTLIAEQMVALLWLCFFLDFLQAYGAPLNNLILCLVHTDIHRGGTHTVHGWIIAEGKVLGEFSVLVRLGFNDIIGALLVMTGLSLIHCGLFVIFGTDFLHCNILNFIFIYCIF